MPAFVDAIHAHFGRIDVLVNNAGINPAPVTAADMTLDYWRKVFSVNLEGPLRMSQQVAPVMRDGGGGSIVNIGTMAAYHAGPSICAYGASKAGLKNLTRTMAMEWAPWNIRVNILSPGPFTSEMLEGAAGPPLAGDEFLGAWDTQPVSALFDKIHATMPADAPGTLEPTQVADLIAYIMQANKFPAGPAELAIGADALKQIGLVAAKPAPAIAAGGSTLTFPVTGTLNQVMRGILFPSSNVLFDVQTKDPSAGSKGGTAKGDATTTSTRYGDVYSPWQVVDAAAISIAEIGPVLMQPRRCHRVYRDVSSAATRCTPH